MLSKPVNAFVAQSSKWTSRLRRLRYGRQVLFYLNCLHFPDILARKLVKTWKHLIYFNEIQKRKRLGREYIARTKRFETIPEQSGYTLLSSGYLALDGVLAACNKIYEEERELIDLRNPDNQFRNSLLTQAHVERFPQFLQLAMSERVVEPVVQYLGTMPTLSSAQLWWTPKNDTTIGSQLFHLDGVDFRQVKLLVNIWPTDKACGPFTFVSASDSERLAGQMSSRRGRKADEEIIAAEPFESTEVIALTGPAGSAAFVDSCRCFHYGGRTRGGERLVLMLQYLRYDCVMESADVDWHRICEATRNAHENDPVAEGLLNLPPSLFS